MLEALESSPPVALLRASFYAYPAVNALHVLAIGVLVTAALLMDARVLGLGRSIPAALVTRYLRPLAIGALLVAALTGFALFAVQATEYVNNSAFRTKLVLLLLALGNAALFILLHPGERRRALLTPIMALLSACLWLAVLLSGRMIGFVGE